MPPPFRFVFYSPADARRRSQPAQTPADAMHKVYAEHIWLSPFRYMRLSAALSLALWPLIVAWLSCRWTLRHGPGIKRKTGKPLLMQMREQREVARASSMLPLRYYQNELFDDALRPRAGEYILFHELKTVLYGLIKAQLPENRRETIKQKDLLADACAEHRLPAPETYLVLRSDGEQRWRTATARLPATDLFVKPLVGKGGRGAERWRYDDARSVWWTPAGWFDQADAMRELRARSRASGVLVQELLRNDDDLLDLTPGALITARVVTQINEAGLVEVTAALLRLPRSALVSVDNVVHGGIAAEIELGSGRLGPAADYRQAAIWFERHPTTGGPIAGRTLRHWDETCALVRRSHVLLAAERSCIGWDIGLCPGGPRIVEANVACDLDFMQRALRRPLGTARVGQLFAFHLARTLNHEGPLRAKQQA